MENFFIWEEKNSTEPQTNCGRSNESVHCDITTETKTDSTLKDWRDITEPKLRKKMRMKEYDRQRYLINKPTRQQYLAANQEKIKKARYIYRAKNKEKIKLQTQKYSIDNYDRMQNYTKQWREENRERIREKNKMRRKTDVQYKLSIGLRDRLRKSVKNNWKNGSAVNDLGCTIDELKKYLESKFQPRMTWDNWTTHGWHIDHIKPLASFDLTDRQQLLEACHYTNLQPLWAKDNLTKKDSIETKRCR